jgi:hypothetical protein
MIDECKDAKEGLDAAHKALERIRKIIDWSECKCTGALNTCASCQVGEALNDFDEARRVRDLRSAHRRQLAELKGSMP